MNKLLTVFHDNVLTGKDDGIPPATLDTGEWVAYRLELKAAQRFRFHPECPLQLRSGKRNLLGDVETELSDDSTVLKVRIRLGTGPWRAKASLVLLPRARGKEVLLVDPMIINKGTS